MRFMVALLLVTLFLPLQPGGASSHCTADHVWFLGVADDSAERDDFKQDAVTFGIFLEELRKVYCIPDAQAEILAFDGSFTLDGTTYTHTEASEENLMDRLASFGTEASKHSDSIFFYFHSSHGLAYSWPVACSPLRTYGSYAALHSDGGGADGFLDDCELGNALNTDFDPDVRMVVAVDCSFCGGFSDSLTAASGTVPDGPVASSGVPGPNRVVMTGCAMTTECFGGGVHGGGVFYDNLRQVIDEGSSYCDGWTAPGFPTVQGFDVPVKNTVVHAPLGSCTASEWFFAAVMQAYTSPVDPIAIQQQFRIKYGLPDLASDIQVLA